MASSQSTEATRATSTANTGVNVEAVDQTRTAEAPSSDPCRTLPTADDTDLPAAVLAAQQVLILRRVAVGVFEIIPPAPPWLARLATPPTALKGPFPLADCFPYLEVCLPEAEALWRTGSGAPLHSGLWTEPTLDGNDLQLEATALPLEQGSMLLIRRAESEHTARQQVLQLARERMLDHERLLEEISAKEILLHCIIHDLAGPLTGIQGCLELLATRARDAEDTEFVRLGLLQAGRQQRLIRTLLDVFANPDPSGHNLPAQPAPSHDLIACVDVVAEGMRPAFLAKRVDLRTRRSDGLQPAGWVIAEASRLERVLYNLLENALRFAPVSSAVTVHLHEDGEWLGVTVTDEGPGVAPEVLPHLFHQFITGGRWPGKSGLGLFFCRITLERWGGSIACLSGEGTGGRFQIRLKKANPKP
jgi:signal transduction histidine kinase